MNGMVEIKGPALFSGAAGSKPKILEKRAFFIFFKIVFYRNIFSVS